MSPISTISGLPTLHPDSKLCGFDGHSLVHSFLLQTHSNFLKETLQSIPDSSESDLILIIPDYSVDELLTLVRVMYGLDHSGFVSASLLKTLGIFQLETVRVEYYNDVTMIYDGPLEGFRLNEPDVDSNQLVPPSTNPTSPQPPQKAALPLKKAALETFTPPMIEEAVEVLALDVDPTFKFKAPLKLAPVGLEDSPVQNSLTASTSTKEADEADIPEIFCEFCDKRFKAKRYLRSHIILKHSVDPSSSNKFKEINKAKSFNHKCTICDNVYNSRNIRTHIKKEHPEIELLECCENCGKPFKTEWLLKRHIENVHRNLRNYECSYCDFKAKSRGQLGEHLKIHSGEEHFYCDNCDFKTARKRDFGEHKCKGPKNFPCESCSKKSISAGALRMHIKVSSCNIDLFWSRKFNFFLRSL